MFVKLETNQGVVGWGEATLEGKAGAAMACVNDLKDLIIGSDPMQVEHLYQLMYIGSFYRGGPGAGVGDLGHRPGALGHPRQGDGHAGVRDARRPGGSARRTRLLSRARRGRSRRRANCATRRKAAGVTALKFQLPDLLEWVETDAKIKRAVAHMEMLREGLGPDIDFAVDFHARPSPTVAAIILREIEPLHLLFAEEICPPENVRAMQRAVTQVHYADRDRRAADRCVRLRETDRLGVVDVLQPDIAHVGGITALWKVSAAARSRGNAHGAARLRRPDRRHREPARGRGGPEHPGAGDLRRRGSGREESGLGGPDGLPRHANGRTGGIRFPPSPGWASRSVRRR